MTTYGQNQQPAGPILALDLGQKLVGAAVSDELLITIKRLDPIKRSNWKQLLMDIQTLIRSYDAKTLVLGLPLRLDGTKGDAAEGVIHLARNFSLSLLIPVFLQDERLTSREAETTLKAAGHNQFEVAKLIDSEAAALILRDFLNTSDRTLFDQEKQAPNTK
jgi:putative Holliday junction resolvase